ncbi:hypothetical protein COBT_001722 [Conglomerata obtusa]
MVYENEAYGLYNNAATIIKTLYNKFTSGIGKKSSMFENHTKLNTSKIEDLNEKYKPDLKFFNHKSNICNDTKVNIFNKKRSNAELLKVSKKHKSTYNTDLSCGYCKRRKMGSSGYKNVINCTKNSYSGCNSNKRLNPNTLVGRLNNNIHNTQNLNLHLYRNSFNVKIVSESSKKYFGQTKHQTQTRKRKFKRINTKLVSAIIHDSKKNVRNQKCSEKYKKNMGEFIFSDDQINKTTRLSKRSNVFTSKCRRGRSIYRLEDALNKLSVNTQEEFKVECLIQSLAKFSINI